MIPQYKHTVVIAKRPRGTLAKCQEELEELIDADRQGNAWHSVVEAADLINSTYTFIWRKYRIPFPVVIVIALMTGVYKPIVRLLRRWER